MAESEKKHRVVIVGAGFAGFNAARELSRLSSVSSRGPERDDAHGSDVVRLDQRRIHPARRRKSMSMTWQDP